MWAVSIGVARESVVMAFLRQRQPMSKKADARQPDAVFIASPPFVVDRMLELAKVRESDVVYDLGCGDGRIVIAAAKKHGARGIGIELEPALVREAREEARRQEMQDRVEIREQNLFDADFQGATVVALYLLPHLNAKLLPKLAALKPGTRIVAHGSPIPGVVPDQVVRVRSPDGLQEHFLFLWTTPLRTSAAPAAPSVVALPDARAPTDRRDWPMFGGTPSRNMVNSVDKNMPVQWVDDDGKIDHIKWTAKLGSRSYGGPVIAGGRVFVGTNNRNPAPSKSDVEADGKAPRPLRPDVLSRIRRHVSLAGDPSQA